MAVGVVGGVSLERFVNCLVALSSAEGFEVSLLDMEGLW